MATAVIASYPLPSPALFANNAPSTAAAASGTPSQGEESILQKALTKGLPLYLNAGMALPATQEAYEKKFPPIDGELQADLKTAATKFYEAARDSALKIQKHTTKFHSEGYQLIFKIPNGISNIASVVEFAYGGLKEDLEEWLDDDEPDLERFLHLTKRGFGKLTKEATKHKQECTDCKEKLEEFKPIIEADKKELEPVNTAYQAVAPLMQRDIESKKKERDDVQTKINKLKAKEDEKAQEMYDDPSGATGASFTLFGVFSELDEQIKQKNTQLDQLKTKSQKLEEWKALLAAQEDSMDDVRKTIDAAINATEAIRSAYEKMESDFTTILDSFAGLRSNLAKSDPDDRREALKNLAKAQTQWGVVLEQVKVFINTKSYK